MAASVAVTDEDAVERQVRAFNAGDLDEFVGCYAEDVIVEDAEGRAVSSGRKDFRESYGRLFAESPDQRAEIVARVRVGSWVVDEEHISGRSGDDVHAVAIYHLDEDGSIDRVRFLR